MRFRKLVSLCAPLVSLWVILPSSFAIHFADALAVTKKRSTALRQPKQVSNPKIRLAISSFPTEKLEPTTSSTDENKTPVEGTKQASSLLSVGTATVPEEIFNLVKSIIGATVLSLPAGIALMASNGTGSSTTPSGILVSTSSLLIAAMGGISAYTFSLIARVCKMTNSNTYADCWKATKSPSLAWIIALSSTLNCFSINLSFSIVLGETFRQLLSSLFEVGGKSLPGLFAALEAYNSRWRVLLALTATTLMPLCCIKNLSSLAPFSLVGILGMLYTAFVIALRCFDGSYKLPDGRFIADLKSVPSFAGSSTHGASLLQPLQNPKTLILVSMLSTAYIAHFNAPKFYRELKDSDTQPKRFHLGVVASSFGISFLFYALVSSLGYLTFGSATQGMILSNYSTKDVLISVSRFALALSLIPSYPLIFVGLRDGIVDLFNQLSPLLRRDKKDKATQQLVLTNCQSDRLTVGLVSLITILALKITDLRFVTSISGALLGTALIFIFPPLMFRSALKMESERTKIPFTRVQVFERRLCSIIVALGVFISGVGTKMAFAR